MTIEASLLNFLKSKISESTYEFLLNTSMLLMVSTGSFLLLFLDVYDGFWSKFSATFLYVMVILFFTSSAINREVQSPLQRVVFWAFVVAWVAPILFANIYVLVSGYTDCLENANGTFDYLYFSYVTFTTLGYGDIQPLGICKAIGVSEAVLGYIFLGALVGAFVGLPVRKG